MIAKTTWTSGRLEAYARARGLDWRIAHTPNNSTGAYHLLSEDGEPLTRWRSLGWSRVEAEDAIDLHVALAEERI